MTEETFGPTLTIAKVPSMDEAVRRANASPYGLGATVFSGAHGTQLARRIRAGMVSVNSVISFAAIPSLPWGGVGQSGFGRIHGPDGLREFTAAKAIARQRFTAPLHLTTFARTARADKAITTPDHPAARPRQHPAPPPPGLRTSVVSGGDGAVAFESVDSAFDGVPGSVVIRAGTWEGRPPRRPAVLAVLLLVCWFGNGAGDAASAQVSAVCAGAVGLVGPDLVGPCAGTACADARGH